MDKAPERIWANGLGCYGTKDKGGTEYVRADLYEQAVKRAEDNNDRMIDAMSECDTLRAKLEQVKQTLAVRDHESDFLKRRGDKAAKRAEAAERLAEPAGEAEPDALRKWREDQLERVRDGSFLLRTTPPDASAIRDELDIDALFQPLADKYFRDGFCGWTDVANVRDEIRRSLAGAKP